MEEVSIDHSYPFYQQSKKYAWNPKWSSIHVAYYPELSFMFTWPPLDTKESWGLFPFSES